MGMFIRSATAAPYLVPVDEVSMAGCSGTIPGGNPSGAPWAMAVSASWLAVPHGSGSEYMAVYDLATMQKEVLGASPGYACYAACFTPDESLLFVSHTNSGNKYMWQYDTATWTRSAFPGVAPATTPQELQVDPTGRYLAAAFGSAPGVAVWDLDASSATVPLTSLGGQAYTLSFSPDGSRLAVGFSVAPYFKVYDTYDWSEVSFAPLTFSSGVTVARWSPDGQTLFIKSGSTTALVLVDVATWTTRTKSQTASIYDAAWSDDGSVIGVLTGTSPYLQFFDPVSLTLTPATNTSGGVSSYSSLIYTNLDPLWVGAVSPNLVRDAAGTPAARTIHAYDEATGALLRATASAADGSYRLPFIGTDPVRLVFSGEPGENAKVLSGVVPAR